MFNFFYKHYWQIAIFILISAITFVAMPPRKPEISIYPKPKLPSLTYSVQRTGVVDVAKVFGRSSECTNEDLSFIEKVSKIALDNGLNPGILASVIVTESGCDRLAVSPKGAIGLMQIMPKVWKNRFDFQKINLFNEDDNLKTGAKILSDLTRKSGITEALREYEGLGVDCWFCNLDYSNNVLKGSGTIWSN